MASQSLYRKWRSQVFAEVVGQEPIMLTLRNSLSTGRIAHAYLFCGPRGTGKTSTGRILAKALNCLQPNGGEPCDHCEMCRAVAEGRAFDLVEIDAASNRGIDEIRDLREKVRFAPSQARYKVYIIDEVHMLTTDAFNALLKTLEEPPAHVIFILCTTEAHKVPATVMSRCQRFDFRRISLTAAVGRLRYICEQEGMVIDDASLEMVAKASVGSLRDAENLLDQLVAYYGDRIELAQVRDLLGMAGDARMAALVGHLVRGELADGLRVINDVVADGLELRQFNRELVDYLRRVLLVKVGSASLVEASKEELADLEALAHLIPVEDLLRVTRSFNQIDLRYDGQSSLPLELALVECLLERGRSTGGERSEALSAAPSPLADTPPITPATSTVRGASVVSSPHTVPAPAAPPASPSVATPSGAREEVVDVTLETKADGQPLSPELAVSNPVGFVSANWGRALELLRSESKVLETYISDRNASGPFAVEGDKIVLAVGYEVHRTTLEKPGTKRIVEDVLKRVMGRKYTIQCIVLPRNEEERRKRAAEDPVIQEALKQGAKIIKVE